MFTSFSKADGLSGNNFGAICARSSYGVIVATAARVLRFVNGKFEALDGIVNDRDGAVEQILCARDGSLWIGFSNAVIKRWKDGILTTYASKHSKTPQVTVLYQDDAGEIWAAFEQRLQKLINGRFEPVILEDGKIDLGTAYSLFADREGSVWVGLQSNGLARLRVKQLSTLSAREGLPNDSARSVFPDPRGNIWIGTTRGFSSLRMDTCTLTPNWRVDGLEP